MTVVGSFGSCCAAMFCIIRMSVCDFGLVLIGSASLGTFSVVVYGRAFVWLLYGALRFCLVLVCLGLSGWCWVVLSGIVFVCVCVILDGWVWFGLFGDGLGLAGWCRIALFLDCCCMALWFGFVFLLS